jgi:hypothetical protein
MSAIPENVTYEIHQVDNKFQVKKVMKAVKKKRLFPSLIFEKKVSSDSNRGTNAKNKTQPVPENIQGRLSRIPDNTGSNNFRFFRMKDCSGA